MARRHRIGLVIVGALGVAAIAVRFVFVTPTSPGSAAKGPSERESSVQPNPATAPHLGAVPSAAGVPVSPLDAEDEAEQRGHQIIADSRAAYAACDTYEDNGTYDMVFRGDAGFSTEKEFHTTVAGPGAIRFAYRDPADEFHRAQFTQLVADEAGTYLFLPWGTAPERQKSLELGVAGMTGISGGVIDAILPLLQSGLGVRSALDVKGARVVGTEEIDETMCDIIEAVRGNGAFASPRHARIWIAQSDSLIRRLSEDDVESEEDSRKRPPMPDRHLAWLREAGMSDADIELFRAQSEKPISTFETITFHPKCNEPVRPDALRATDGSL